MKETDTNQMDFREAAESILENQYKIRNIDSAKEPFHLKDVFGGIVIDAMLEFAQSHRSLDKGEVSEGLETSLGSTLLKGKYEPWETSVIHPEGHVLCTVFGETKEQSREYAETISSRWRESLSEQPETKCPNEFCENGSVRMPYGEKVRCAICEGTGDDPEGKPTESEQLEKLKEEAMILLGKISVFNDEHPDFSSIRGHLNEAKKIVRDYEVLNSIKQ